MMSDDSDIEYVDEDVKLLKKCLDVELPEDFDPNIVPTNGLEYVQMVMYERTHCEDIVTAQIDSSKIAKPDLQIPEIELPKVHDSLKPSLKWQTEKVEDFKNLQKYMQRKLDSVPSTTYNALASFNRKILEDYPDMDTILNMNGMQRYKIISYLSEKLELIPDGETFDYVTGMWIYALMSTYCVPLCSSTASVFRDICRKCAHMRQCLDENTPEDVYKPLNLIICIVSRYFGQFDLADE